MHDVVTSVLRQRVGRMQLQGRYRIAGILLFTPKFSANIAEAANLTLLG